MVDRSPTICTHSGDAQETLHSIYIVTVFTALYVCHIGFLLLLFIILGGKKMTKIT